MEKLFRKNNKKIKSYRKKKKTYRKKKKTYRKKKRNQNAGTYRENIKKSQNEYYEKIKEKIKEQIEENDNKLKQSLGPDVLEKIYSEAMKNKLSSLPLERDTFDSKYHTRYLYGLYDNLLEELFDQLIFNLRNWKIYNLKEIFSFFIPEFNFANREDEPLNIFLDVILKHYNSIKNNYKMNIENQVFVSNQLKTEMKRIMMIEINRMMYDSCYGVPDDPDCDL